MTLTLLVIFVLQGHGDWDAWGELLSLMIFDDL